MDEDEDWIRCRKAELKVMAPTKRKKKVEPFVKVPLWWMEQVAKATNNLKALVAVELLHAAWKAKRSTIPLPNGRLEKLGIHREIKRRAIRDLERAGLIKVERPARKTVVVTLVLL